jgi:hypothetical protein
MRRATMKHVGLLMAAGILVTTFSLAGCGGGSGVGGGVGGGVGLPPGFSFLGIALVGRPDGSSTTAGFHTDITVARGLNTATPA